MVIAKQKPNNCTFGIDSKFGAFFFRYPFYTAFIFFLLIEIVIVLIEWDLEVFLRSAILLSSVLLLNLLVAYHFTNNYCYKIIVDTDQKSVQFYLFFNRGVKTEGLNDVKVVIHKTCDLVINTNSYTIFPGVLHEITPYLPQNTEVIFSGIFGRIKKRKQWNYKPPNNLR